MRALTLLAALLLSAGVAHAQLKHPTAKVGEDWTVTAEGQIRPRVNLDTGLDLRDVDAARHSVVTQRSRVGATLAHQNGVAMTFRLQDVRIWGEEEDTLNSFDASGLDVHEAFVVVPVPKVAGLKVKFGRQEINLANQRLVGAVDWTQRARSFDALRLTYGWDAHDAGAFFARVREFRPFMDGNVSTRNPVDVNLGGLHATYALSPLLKATALYLINARHPEQQVRHTAGVFAAGEKAGAAWSAEGYYQFGRLGANTISAFMLGARGGYTAAQAPGKPGAALFADFLSGEGNAWTSFDTLYATNHKFYGEMDFFTVFPRHTAGRGLLDAGLQLSATLLPDVRASADYHYFRSQTDSPSGRADLGHELDLKVGWVPLPNFSISALYGFFLPKEGMRDIRAVPAHESLRMEHGFWLTTDVAF